MLVEFSVKNLLSFREEQRFSLIAASDRASFDDTISTPALGKERVLKSAVIYGPNAADKSNLIKALTFVRELVTESLQRSPSQETGVQPFRLDRETRKAASRFVLTFIQEGVRYEYTLAVTASEIKEETLIAYPKGRPQRWFERRSSSEHEQIQLKIGTGLKGVTALSSTLALCR